MFTILPLRHQRNSTLSELLKTAGEQKQDMFKVFRSSVRPILEYAVQVWQDIPDYLSDRIESVQKRALKIISPDSSYSEVVSLTDETTLSNRREQLLCLKFIAEIADTRDHPLSCLLSTVVQRTNPYTDLRPGSSRPFNQFMRTKRSEDFLRFKYSSFKFLS